MAALFLISSCAKNNEQIPINEAKISSTVAMNTKDERKIAYRLLNAAEKAEVWKRHLSECAKDASLSNEQRVFINSIIPALNVQRFAKSLKKGDKDSQLEDWQSQANQLFQVHEIAWLLNDITMNKLVYKPIPDDIKEKLLSKISYSNQLQQVGSRRVAADCGCSGDSDYCGGYQGTNGCIARYNVCSGGSGCAITGGCGWLWGYTCNGSCATQNVNICN